MKSWRTGKGPAATFQTISPYYPEREWLTRSALAG